MMTLEERVLFARVLQIQYDVVLLLEKTINIGLPTGVVGVLQGSAELLTEIATVRGVIVRNEPLDNLPGSRLR